MIFLTVGTLYPFDRLVKIIDTLAGSGRITEPVFGQIGFGDYQPQHIQTCRVLEKDEFDEKVKTASVVICHAGMGSIITAITLKKPMIVMPRLKKHGEAVNDHQVETGKKFEELGIVLFAADENGMAEKISMVQDFKPAERQFQIEPLKARIATFLGELNKKGFE